MRSPTSRWLIAKDLRELAASRAFWILLLAAGLLAGHAFLDGIEAYAEMSGTNGGPAALAQGLSPLDGIVVPVLGTLSLAAMLLLPFVVIRLVAHEKQTGAWTLLVQGPATMTNLLSSKVVVLLGAWLLTMAPSAIALVWWHGAGNHLDTAELFSVVVGHFLVGWITIGVATAGAAIMDGEANAAIATLAFTIGTWALEMLATARGGLFAALAALTPGAMQHSFDQGLIRSDAVAVALVVGLTGLAVAAIWLKPGHRRRRQWIETAILVLIAAGLSVWAGQLRPSWDLSGDRRNSFAAADEAALRSISQPLRIEVHLAPEDPRLEDLRRGVLDKLQRLLPALQLSYVARTRTGLFEQTDSLYGTIIYRIGARTTSSRSVTAPIVLEQIFEAAGVAVPPAATSDYPGYPLVRRPAAVIAIFFIGWPLLLALVAGALRRNWRKFP